MFLESVQESVIYIVLVAWTVTHDGINGLRVTRNVQKPQVL